jgi:hypothetical protein
MKRIIICSLLWLTPCSATEVTGYTRDEVVSPANQQKPAEQTESAAETMARVRDALVKRDMQIEITKLKGDKARLQSRRDIEITKLRRSKLNANNNLAGAVWENSLSKEMAAITAKYDTDIRAVDSEIDRLSKKLRRL